MISRGQHGDTIVEVLIALTVVSVILGGAFVSSTNSLNNSRAAQERGEALKFVQGQIESLKLASINKNLAINSRTKIFCMSGDLAFDTDKDIGNLPPANADNTVYPADCQQGTDSRYKLSIDRQGSDTFQIRARWQKVGNGTMQELKIAYKIHE